jgi:hypothetical protein
LPRRASTWQAWPLSSQNSITSYVWIDLIIRIRVIKGAPRSNCTTAEKALKQTKKQIWHPSDRLNISNETRNKKKRKRETELTGSKRSDF